MELRASICEALAIADTAGQLQSVSFQSITVRIRVRARRVRGIVREGQDEDEDDEEMRR
jgi:hypothetical protein